MVLAFAAVAKSDDKGADTSEESEAPADKKRKLLWADEEDPGSNVAEDVPSVDMFGGGAELSSHAVAAGVKEGVNVPFHLRQQAELVRFSRFFL